MFTSITTDQRRPAASRAFGGLRSVATRGLLAAALALPLLLLQGAALAQDAEAPADYLEMPLEELLSISVTSVSKHAEPMHHAAAAVYVLTSEDLRRSGARSVAEALRMVPGLQVARVNTHNWAISARGFNGLRADKMQVLVDGRSVYSPLASTVAWEVLGTQLLDVARVEVIRGPGASLWGANAVNGVINIVTHAARDTTGTVAQLGMGTVEKPSATVRSGSRWGDSGHARWYAHSSGRDASEHPDGAALDGQRISQLGFRSDWQGAEQRSEWTLSGDLFREEHGIRGSDGAADTGTLGGGHLSLRYARPLADRSKLSMRADLSRARREDPSFLTMAATTGDLQFQHDLVLGTDYLSYGAGLRLLRSEGGDPDDAYRLSEHGEGRLDYSVFVQGQRPLGTAGQLTLGSRVDYDHHTGWELQPNLRLRWDLSDQSMTWAALSRAARLPNEVETSVQLLCSPAYARAGACAPAGSRVPLGNHHLDPTYVNAVEWGLRWWNGQGWSVDLALFHLRYDDLIALEGREGAYFGQFGSNSDAHSMGAELALRWQPAPHQMLELFYSHLDLEVRTPDTGQGFDRTECAGCADPRHSVGLRWMRRLTARSSLDGALRYVSALGGEIPAYLDLNLRAAWRPRPRLELALVGSDLLHDDHREFPQDAQVSWLRSAPIPRSGQLQLTWEW